MSIFHGIFTIHDALCPQNACGVFTDSGHYCHHDCFSVSSMSSEVYKHICTCYRNLNLIGDGGLLLECWSGVGNNPLSYFRVPHPLNSGANAANHVKHECNWAV